MPIARTTMIDDDGSGTTGTILNNAWLQTIYTQIDTAPWTFSALNQSPGYLVDWNPGIVGNTLIAMQTTGAAGTLIELMSFDAPSPYPGQQIKIYITGPGTLRLHHNNAAGTAQRLYLNAIYRDMTNSFATAEFVYNGENWILFHVAQGYTALTSDDLPIAGGVSPTDPG